MEKKREAYKEITFLNFAVLPIFRGRVRKRTASSVLLLMYLVATTLVPSVTQKLSNEGS